MADPRVKLELDNGLIVERKGKKLLFRCKCHIWLDRILNRIGM